MTARRRETFSPAHGLSGAVVFPSSLDSIHPNHGKSNPTPTPTMERVLAVPADDPAAERWVTLRTVRVANSDAYAAVVVDGRNVVVDWRGATLTPDIAKARAAANRLYNRIAKEE